MERIEPSLSRAGAADAFDRTEPRFFPAEARASIGASGPPRDPVIAEWLGAGGMTSTGLSITPDSAMRVSAVYACVKLISNALAMTPALFYQLGADNQRERATTTWVGNLLATPGRPNRWQTPFQFKQTLQAHLCLRGVAYAEQIAANDGSIAELIPLHPDRVTPFRAPDGSVAFEYSPMNGPRRIILQSEMLFLADLTIGDTLKPLSPIAAHRETVGLAAAGREYIARFFGNNAQPKGAIKLPAGIGDPAAKLLRESWERRHQGLENQHRIAILDGGMEYEALGMTNEDAQYLEIMRFGIEDIARIFQVPPHMIGAIDKSTSWGTGIEQQAIGFRMYTMTPWFTLWEECLGRDVIPARMAPTYFFEFLADALVRGDYKTRVEGKEIEIRSSQMTPNEGRRLENRPAKPGGDRLIRPINFAAVGDDGNCIIPAGQKEAAAAASGSKPA